MAITSTAGAGTTVTLWFPEASIVEGQAAPAVDDDQLVLEMLIIELQELECQTI